MGRKGTARAAAPGKWSRRLAVGATVGASLALALAGCGGAGEAVEAPPDAVVMTSNAFEPSARTVGLGETITFVNETTGALHILVIGDGGVARAGAGRARPRRRGRPPQRARGRLAHAGVVEPGRVPLTCTVHPDMTMTVNVTG